MTEYFETIDELNIKEIKLDELLVAIGSSLFSGCELPEIDTKLLNHLEGLIKIELILREQGMGMSTDETVH